MQTTCQLFRSSRPEVFLIKGSLKICCKFTTEHLCRSVISKKLHHTSAWVFSCESASYFQNTFSYEHLWTAASDSCFKQYSHYHEVTAPEPSFLKITDKFGYISYEHFFSALVNDSGRLETLEALCLLFHWTPLSLK